MRLTKTRQRLLDADFLAADIRVLAENDIRCHQQHGASLNPYSTHMARTSWQRGFDGKPLRNSVDYSAPYQRGVVAASLLKTE